jgi:hypothetical protein
MFEKRVLRSMFEPKRKEVRGGWVKLYWSFAIIIFAVVQM